MGDGTRTVAWIVVVVVIVAVAGFFALGQFYGQAARTENEVPAHRSN